MNLARVFLASMGIIALASPAFAQRPPREGPGGGPPDRPGFGGPRMDELKDALNASQEQWTLLAPKIQKIQQLRRDVSGSGGGMGGPGGGFGPGGPPPGGGFGPGGPDQHGSPDDSGPNGNGSPDGPPPTTRPAHSSATTRPAHAPPLAGFAEHGPHEFAHPNDDGPGPGRGGPHRSDVQDKLDDLSDALDTNAKPDEIRAKIAALHEARAKARTGLEKSQDELRGMIDARQEAVLITMGVLD